VKISARGFFSVKRKECFKVYLIRSQTGISEFRVVRHDKKIGLILFLCFMPHYISCCIRPSVGLCKRTFSYSFTFLREHIFMSSFLCADKKLASRCKLCIPGANPTIVSYNASAVKIYSATSSPVRFETMFSSIYFEKRSSLLQHWRCDCKLRSL
jgi:hypothetical protein